MSGTTGSGAEIDIGRVCGTVGCGGEVVVDILHRRGGCGDGGGEDVFFFLDWWWCRTVCEFEMMKFKIKHDDGMIWPAHCNALRHDDKSLESE